MVATLTPEAVEALLVFYRDAGVDVPLSEEAIDRFAEARADAAQRSAAVAERVSDRLAERPEPGRPAVPARPNPVSAVGSPPAPEAAVSAARELALSAVDLDQLKALLETFDGCALKTTASRTVFEDGARDARIMFVGEAPGREEDMEGKPFVGRSGQLLDRMMAAVGLNRQTNAYIANIIPWRPPGNRTPTPQEIAICEPFIRRQIELKAPDLLVCVGAPSTETLLGIKGIMRARGRAVDYDTGGRTIPALPILHPAYLLRSPLAKRQAWRDMLTIKAMLGL
ncbi:uracil-DNA glycosylase [Phreatobacter aquaticus]|uniref:Type-4 uracil-DNA glycosylase n=1 Tax=Phreatobacter aquaticus TaxID=2570229 RepID=A0A4D7QP38_9HYPH|nr:uracil-DNA glycosylase [Phreatobacter aquaticus]QCK88241.1 uracil-DNA glycosylase [Phreatobacter aquaticus]